MKRDDELLAAVEGALPDGQDWARLRREVAELQRENHALRVSRAALVDELRQRREGYRLPEPHEVSHRVYVLPLMVGEPPALLSDAFDHPDDLPRHYRLTFVREYGERGDFWRVQPFATEPRGRR